MKRLVTAAAALLCACNPNKTVLDAEFHPTDRGWGSREPVWADEFDGTALDPAKWVVAQFCGGFNHEKQCYRPNNISVGGGYLTITAKVQTCEGDDPATLANEVGTVDCQSDDPNKPNFSYTSGRIHTRIDPLNLQRGWRGGRIEIRAKLPHGTGTWPAFWMLPFDVYGPWPRSGEIDIMEAADLSSPNVAADYVQSNIHLCHENAYNADNNPAATTECQKLHATYHKVSYAQKLYPTSVAGWSSDLSTQFHTYSMEWSDWDMRFFLDDHLIGRVLHRPDAFGADPFTQRFYLLINLAVGGDMPSTPAPSSWSASPEHAELVLDWVRVYMCVPDLTSKNCIYQGDSGIGRK
jgi:beta-glucanase (GH16 family)